MLLNLQEFGKKKALVLGHPNLLILHHYLHLVKRLKESNLFAKKSWICSGKLAEWGMSIKPISKISNNYASQATESTA